MVTKIIATLGPSSFEKVEQLYNQGAQIFRLNLSHGTVETHYKAIKEILRIEKKLKAHIGILLDTNGPDIRLGEFDAIDVKPEQRITLSCDGTKGIPLRECICSKLRKGVKILIDDGIYFFKVINIKPHNITIESQSYGRIRSGKSINIPNIELNKPILTPKDKTFLKSFENLRIDFLALSFVSRKKDILVAKKFLKTLKINPWIISKIENSLGVKNFDEILNKSDGIMIARGDLGAELSLENIPRTQIEMIKKCNHASKPSIVATQMLQSMIINPRPTRAEVNDVFTSTSQGADALMLSGETATGAYPVESVREMRKIMEKAKVFIKINKPENIKDANSKYITIALYGLIKHNPNAFQQIIILTDTGYSARLISSLNSNQDIITLTPNKDVVKKMLLLKSIIPKKTKNIKNNSQMRRLVLKVKENEKIDKALIVFGTPFGKGGTTNTIKIL